MEAPARQTLLPTSPQGEREWLTSETQGQRITLLDGGTEAYPRMLEAIGAATRRVHLEVYAFEREGVGSHFIAALTAAAHRGVEVKVIVDGWGSIGESRALSDTLRAAGIKVRIHNPLTSVFLGRFWRNHRKILLVDDTVAFLGGINIGDHYATQEGRPGWADLALELRGNICAQLGEKLNAGASTLSADPVRILLSGFGGGRRLRARYLAALKDAREKVVLAHAYFLPDMGFMRALKRAARRGVEVHLLLAGRSDVPFARAATMRLYRTLLLAGVRIHEWTATTLHAKAAVVDGERLLVGSFNLDPLSLVNLETLVEVEDAGVAAQATRWMERHVSGARQVTLGDCARSGLQRWLLDVVGLAVARLSERIATFMGYRRMRRRG
ncbi:phosphatidylserine/phosphatidylglycerophosphate/cardiolipin synthase family protein [Vitiosangium sp. GDMCC 1.1324]|uniref:phospholipase D-like domain-containing protein n=1 Tax=Vitiosangium sp. (strain GDMCC 1.1324) TaxID=2138576 RepID=UPI000D3CBF04|nr:phospholipase D-like domain-containing protein [Vitiosangium sp. GDMCC 1.1324]PTL84132.1 cardiolipin synthase B [Vitiosangium sp. GDMCC 1.1324]